MVSVLMSPAHCVCSDGWITALTVSPCSSNVSQYVVVVVSTCGGNAMQRSAYLDMSTGTHQQCSRSVASTCRAVVRSCAVGSSSSCLSFSYVHTMSPACGQDSTQMV